MKNLKLQVLWVLMLNCFTEGVPYDRYQVLRVSSSRRAGGRVQRLVAETAGAEVWRRSVEGAQEVWEVLVPPAGASRFASDLSHGRYSLSVKIEDVQKLLDEQKSERAAQRRHRASSAFSHSNYNDLEDVSAGGSGTRQVVWIDCGIHAREWISPATCQWVLDQLTSGYNEDPGITELLDAYDFHILPVVNPDGYAFSWDEDRLWRKNRHPYNETCVGVDLNRNFDSHFGGIGSSNIHCLPIYHGEMAFSEYETQAVRDSLTNLKGRLKAYFALHSFSQKWMFPYGYNFEKPENYDEQLRVASIGAEALFAVNGTEYSVGSQAITIYPSAGTAVDWVYDSLGVPYTYIIELPDKGDYGFLLPPSFIIPVGQETWAGIMAAIKSM
ncbi:carboxypeptidase A2-like isoform X2 [Penaeus chinensis]|uniref:carboxypeptidase A2-like isoform X2 n=1 Tax=Penaeus chinensis TaxID=139456 RepID=UPI001FB731DC|nr:carboxypeptidase A2-like isoform X2 [Penaeus chinensis]